MTCRRSSEDTPNTWARSRQLTGLLSYLFEPWRYSYTGIPTSVLLTKPCFKAICVLFQTTSIIEMVHGYICSKLPKEFRKVFGEFYNCFLSTLYFHALVMLLISEVNSENFESHPGHWDGNIYDLESCLELTIFFQYKLKFPLFISSGRRHLTSAK